jgi:hypothetical protein
MLWFVTVTNVLEVSMTEGYPDVEICSRCADNTAFEQDEYDQWLSVCCGAVAVELDYPEWDDDYLDYEPLEPDDELNLDTKE